MKIPENRFLNFFDQEREREREIFEKIENLI